MPAGIEANGYVAVKRPVVDAAQLESVQIGLQRQVGFVSQSQPARAAAAIPILRFKKITKTFATYRNSGNFLGNAVDTILLVDITFRSIYHLRLDFNHGTRKYVTKSLLDT